MTAPTAIETSVRPRNRRILVTGGAGFIGSHIAEALVSGNRVRVLDNLSQGSTENVPPGAVLFQGDVRDQADVAEAMEGVDIVFHQAALIDAKESIEHPGWYQSVNVGGTLTVLETARRTNSSVVLASSAAVYGDPGETPIAETASKRPLSPYGLGKLAADHYAKLYHDLHGVETTRLRYFNAYGPRQASGQYGGVVRIFADQAADGGPITVHGDGSQSRDFVHVDDIVRANMLAAGGTFQGRAYNVGSGRSITINQLAELVKSASPRDPEVRFTERPDGDIEQSRADISRARAELGYETVVDLEDRLPTLVEGATNNAVAN